MRCSIQRGLQCEHAAGESAAERSWPPPRYAGMGLRDLAEEMFAQIRKIEPAGVAG